MLFRSHFGWFRTTWLQQVQRCEIGSLDAVLARVRADETIAVFSANAHPIHDFRSKTHVLVGFATFGCRKCTVAKLDPRMPFWHEFRPMKLFSRFSAKMHPILYVWSKAHVLGGFAPFGFRKCTVAKIGSWDAVWARVRANETIFEFSRQNASNPLLYVQISRFG